LAIPGALPTVRVPAITLLFRLQDRHIHEDSSKKRKPCRMACAADLCPRAWGSRRSLPFKISACWPVRGGVVAALKKARLPKAANFKDIGDLLLGFFPQGQFEEKPL
jgi:hypothetical protein